MQLRPDFQIATMIRAMRDVVVPAVDPENEPAVEQSKLVLAMLSLLERQLPLQFRFDRDELARLVASSDRLERVCNGEPALTEHATTLAALSRAARQRLARCTVDPSELLSTVRELRAAIGALVSEAADSTDRERSAQIEREVLALSREQLLRDRALVAPQGFDSGLPAIESLLDGPSPMEDTEP